MGKIAVEQLSDEELLQHFMPKQAALQLVAEYNNLYDVVMHTSDEEIAQVKGVGKERILRLKCLKELIRRFQVAESAKITTIRSAIDVIDCLNDLQYLKQEQFRIILLNTKNKVLGQRIISQGTISGTLVSAREIFNPAIKLMAASIILAHNHPSGLPEPSQEDMQITRTIVEAGKIIGIQVLDHIIIGKSAHYSFKQHGYM